MICVGIGVRKRIVISVIKPRGSLQERLYRRTRKTPYCWIWTGWVDKDGYGKISLGAKHLGSKPTHVVSYELAYGSVPEGLIVEHECNNPFCVNPDHLRATTQRFNVMRSEGPAALNAKKTHCPKKHEYTPNNTYWFPTRTGWGRSCCICNKRRSKGKSDWPPR